MVVVVTGLGVVVCSVVVVLVVGLGAAVSCVVVVELRVGSAGLSFTVVQADSVARTVAARHGMISFFMSIMVVRTIILRYEITRSVGHLLWGVTPPDTLR